MNKNAWTTALVRPTMPNRGTRLQRQLAAILKSNLLLSPETGVKPVTCPRARGEVDRNGSLGLSRLILWSSHATQRQKSRGEVNRNAWTSALALFAIPDAVARLERNLAAVSKSIRRLWRQERSIAPSYKLAPSPAEVWTQMPVSFGMFDTG